MAARHRPHPTDRGWAWVVLIAAMGSHLLNGGLTYFVGVVHAGLLETFQPDSVTFLALTGALYSALVTLSAPVASYIITRFSCRVCCMLGGVLCFVGYTSSAFVTSVYQLFFTYGICSGVGLGFVYSATNITVGFYFHKLVGVASGIANSFQAVGILIGPVMFQVVMESYQVRGAIMLVGAASLHFCLFGLFFRPTRYEGKPVVISVEEPNTNTPSVEISGCKTVNETTSASNQNLAEDVWRENCVEVEVVEEEDSSTKLLLPTGGDQTSADVNDYLQHSPAVSPSADTGSDVTSSSVPLLAANVKTTAFETDNTKIVSRAIEHDRASNSEQNCCSVDGVPLVDEVDDLKSSGEAIRSSQSNIDAYNGISHEDTETREITRGMAFRRWIEFNPYLTVLDKAFTLHCISLFFANIHVSGVFLHLPEYVSVFGTSPAQGAELFLAVGSCSLLSKLACGLATSDPRIEPLILSLGLMGLNGIITCFFPLYSGTYAKQMVFSSLFGLYFGGLYALSTPILVRFVGVERLAYAYGVSMFATGMGYVSGPPVAAMILDNGGSYSHSFIFLGLTMLLAAFFDMGAACFLASSKHRPSPSLVAEQGEASATGDDQMS